MNSFHDEADMAAWLDALVVHGAPRGDTAIGLARALMVALGHPHRAAPAVHIVGTAGKGTTAALLTDRLVAAGVAVASHQSPHVDDIRERFMINGELLDWRVVLDAAETVARAAESVRDSVGRPPSFFDRTMTRGMS